MSAVPTFQWTSPATFEVINVLTSTEERYTQAVWNAETWLYPEDSLRSMIDDVPLAEPIDLDSVDWKQVEQALLQSRHD